MDVLNLNKQTDAEKAVALADYLKKIIDNDDKIKTLVLSEKAHELLAMTSSSRFFYDGGKFYDVLVIKSDKIKKGTIKVCYELPIDGMLFEFPNLNVG